MTVFAVDIEPNCSRLLLIIDHNDGLLPPDSHPSRILTRRHAVKGALLKGLLCGGNCPGVDCPDAIHYGRLSLYHYVPVQRFIYISFICIVTVSKL